MKKIINLTPEQEAHLPIYREEVRARALRLQWASDDEMRDCAVRLYEAASLAKPIVFILDSPLQCLMARMILRHVMKGDQLRDQLWGQLWDQLRGQLWDQLGGQLGDQLWDQLGGQLGDQLWDQLGDQLWDQDVEYQDIWFAGGSEGYWAAFYDFARLIGATYDKGHWLDVWMEYADKCGAIYPYEGAALLSRRPTALHFDDARVLHSETGPAMAFGDGFAIHAWHGTRVPAHWIEQRDMLDPAEVLACDNVEQRAAGAAIIGWPKMAAKLNRRVLDGNPDTDVGALVELTLPGLDEPGRFLMAQCPRNGTICEGLPRISDVDGLPIETAIAAQAWRLGLAASEFTIPTKRT